MMELWQILRKELLVDWRQRNPLLGMLLYVIATVYIVFLSFRQAIDPEDWSTLYWIILLFIAMSGLNGTFTKEKNRTAYYYFTMKPGTLITGKILYSIFYLLVLGMLALGTYMLFLPSPGFSFWMFVVNLVNGIIGISVSLTFLSSLSIQASQRVNLLPIMGFPVLLPILTLAIRNSTSLVLGGGWEEIWRNSLTLGAVNVLIITLSVILFPYSWRP